MIAHAQKTVVIRRPVASVFDFVLNGANNRLWKSSVLDVRPLGLPPYGVGSKFQQQVRGTEGPVTGDYQITEYKANELIGIQMMSGPARWSGRYEFRSTEPGTALTCTLDYESSEYDPALAKQVLDRMQGLLKAEPAASALLSEQERRALLMRLDGKTNRDIAKSMYAGEGTVRNYVYSGLSKLMAPGIERSMQEEVDTLDELKTFLEKIA